MMTIINLKPDSCRFIVSEDGAKTTYYCGETAQGGSSYCPTHHNICYVPAKQKTKEAA
jgi:hypothetical protein